MVLKVLIQTARGSSEAKILRTGRGFRVDFAKTGAFAEFERTMIRQRVKAWPQASGCSRREARPTEDRQRDRAEGAKAACERCGYLEGRQIARDRNWYGAAHLKGASNEPARGAAMTSGPPAHQQFVTARLTPR